MNEPRIVINDGSNLDFKHFGYNVSIKKDSNGCYFAKIDNKTDYIFTSYTLHHVEQQVSKYIEYYLIGKD